MVGMVWPKRALGMKVCDGREGCQVVTPRLQRRIIEDDNHALFIV